MKTILVKLGLIASCVVLTACGGGSSATWQKQGVSLYDRDNMMNRCKYEIGMNSSVPDNSPKANALFSQCMQKEGFRYY